MPTEVNHVLQCDFTDYETEDGETLETDPNWSIRVGSFTADLVLRKWAHGNRVTQRSMVEESSA